jgi:NAD(P)H dehydrogenase (quinone)
MSKSSPILVTGAAGRVGSVGRKVVNDLRKDGYSVRAMVREDDDRAQSLRETGAQVVCGDLTNPVDVVRVLDGCKRAYFGTSVSASYLEASCIFAAAAKEKNDLEVLVNISQMTVSQMSLTNMTNSPQQKMHWLAEQVMNWSGIPVVHVRATAFLEHFFFSSWAAESIEKDGVIRLPFGNAKTSPIATDDVASVVAAILKEPNGHIGKVYELTGPKSQDITAMATEYAEALHRPVKYVAMPFDEWYATEFLPHGLPGHVASHIKEMARLHAADRYNRQTNDVEKVTGRAATSVKEYVERNVEVFGAVKK